MLLEQSFPLPSVPTGQSCGVYIGLAAHPYGGCGGDGWIWATPWHGGREFLLKGSRLPILQTWLQQPRGRPTTHLRAAPAGGSVRSVSAWESVRARRGDTKGPQNGTRSRFSFSPKQINRPILHVLSHHCLCAGISSPLLKIHAKALVMSGRITPAPPVTSGVEPLHPLCIFLSRTYLYSQTWKKVLRSPFFTHLFPVSRGWTASASVLPVAAD